MRHYVKKMTEEIKYKMKENVTCPWNEKMFKVDESSKPLDKTRAKDFYTFVMKGMFLCKQGRQDIHPIISFLNESEGTNRARLE